MTDGPRNTILMGDVLERLRELPSSLIDCVITSPPYFQLRDYGVSGQLGLEGHVDEWVANQLDVCRQVARVLRRSGSLWLNLGDSYSRHTRYGAPPKAQLLAPERLLLALSGNGWLVRNKVIWAKPNPMPASVSDRLNTTYEVVYFLVRTPRYFFDLDAIRVPHRSSAGRSVTRTASARRPGWAGPLAGTQSGLHRARPGGLPGHWLGKNPGDVWTIPTAGYRGAHFATFPAALVEKPLLATCPEAVCTRCDRPWKRAVRLRRIGGESKHDRDRFVRRYPKRWETLRQVGELVPCGCGTPTRPGLVLDPFFGSGTVGAVAEAHGRDWLGIELNPDYAKLAWQRLGRRPGDQAQAA